MLSQNCRCQNRMKLGVFLRSTERSLDASGAAKANRHLITVDNHRHGAAAVAEPQHALKLRRALLDVDVLERNLPPLKVVTGGLRVRSGVFSEDVDHAVILARGQPRGRTGACPHPGPHPVPGRTGTKRGFFSPGRTGFRILCDDYFEPREFIECLWGSRTRSDLAQTGDGTLAHGTTTKSLHAGTDRSRNHERP